MNFQKRMINNLCFIENHLKVFNVGQGDMFLIEPIMSSCRCGSTSGSRSGEYYSSILIDAGHSIKETEKLLNKFQKKIKTLILTHSHKDHIGGIFRELITNVKQICIPAYLEEMIKIYESLGKKSNSRNNIIRDFKEVTSWSEDDSITWNKGTLNVLNPPFDHRIIYKNIDYKSIKPNENINIKKLFNIITEITRNSKLEIDKKIKSCIDQKVVYTHLYSLSKLQDAERHKEVVHEDDDKTLDRVSFFLCFYNILNYLVENTTNEKEIKDIVVKFEKHLSNQVSLVFKINNVLFTGDADESVFNRICSNNNNDISADILKFPHHGADNTLSDKHLQKIDPKCVIFSFGRKNKYGHPSHNKIKMVTNFAPKPKIILTNDIINKSGKVLHCSTKGSFVCQGKYINSIEIIHK
ncbi:MBL fold metallo-hydrolase [Candidatus Dojkabacteria bacterium]|nr:MBL fold metallo-hydrolase [Candidatus Dojkabacteria bacterium]